MQHPKAERREGQGEAPELGALKWNMCIYQPITCTFGTGTFHSIYGLDVEAIRAIGYSWIDMRTTLRLTDELAASLIHSY